MCVLTAIKSLGEEPRQHAEYIERNAGSLLKDGDYSIATRAIALDELLTQNRAAREKRVLILLLSDEGIASLFKNVWAEAVDEIEGPKREAMRQEAQNAVRSGEYAHAIYQIGDNFGLHKFKTDTEFRDFVKSIPSPDSGRVMAYHGSGN